MREFCRIELDRLDRQIQLLRSVLWWYIAPCILGVNIMFVGMAGLGIDSLVYFIVTLLFAWGIVCAQHESRREALGACSR